MTNKKTQEPRKPYEKKLRDWENEIENIENFIKKLPDINSLNLGPLLLKQLLKKIFHSDKYKFSEKLEKLNKIKSGVRKMTETLSHTMSNESSNPDLENYLKRIVNLRLKINQLSKKLQQKDPQEYIQSIINDE